ncbi:hypothetical protein [Natronomonas moolapensis]|nr:hypothetical protein [Natronomonas moolapensis]
MSYDFAERETVQFGVVSELFPVAELDAPLVQSRDAQLRREALDEEAIIAVAPESMATGYHLGSHELTLIAIDDLPKALTRAVSAAVDGPIEAYSHIQLGKRIESGSNRSLSEFEAATPATRFCPPGNKTATRTARPTHLRRRRRR